MVSDFYTDSEATWQQVKQVRHHEFYHLPEYVSLDAQLLGGTPVCWVADTGEGKVWIPLVRRRIPEQIAKGKEYYDLTSPYGYAGILWENPLPPDVMNKILLRFQKDAAEANYITSFLRMNPIYNPYMWQQTDLIKQVCHGYTITVPLDADIEQIRSNFSSNHRRDLRKLKKQQFRFFMDDLSYWQEFQKIYLETMDRLDAKDYYYFSESYFERLFKILGDHIHLAIVTNESGKEIAAGGLLTDFNNVIQSHLVATKTTFLDYAPSKLMFDGVITWAAENAYKWLHLGGGLNSREDSLYRFKKGFSPVRNQFSTLRIIHDKQRYNNLNYIALQENGQEEFKDPDFFPLYRQVI